MHKGKKVKNSFKINFNFIDWNYHKKDKLFIIIKNIIQYNYNKIK